MCLVIDEQNYQMQKQELENIYRKFNTKVPRFVAVIWTQCAVHMENSSTELSRDVMSSANAQRGWVESTTDPD